MKLLQPERPKTQTEIRRLFRNVSEEKAEQFDKNIRKKIANDSSHESINKYVADELKGKKARGLSAPIRRGELAEKYKENNSKWMSQENIFCFFALLISVVSMLLVLANKYFKNDLWTSDLVQFILYFSSFLVFKFVECKGWVYKDKRFNKFLEILNRNAPVLIILSTTIFYGLSLTLYIHELKLTYFAMLIFALVPLGAIVKTVVQMSPT